MWQVEKSKRKKLGILLRECRVKNNLAIKSVQNITGVDGGTLHRLEQGENTRVNPLMLRSLAKLYNIRVMELYKTIDYINDDEISEHIDNEKFEEKKEKNVIEVFEIDELLTNKSNVFKEYLKVPDLEEGYKALKYNSDIFIFTSNQDIENNDLGIFNIDNSVVVGYYNFKDNIIVICDYYTKKILILKTEEIELLGKVDVVINYKKQDF